MDAAISRAVVGCSIAFASLLMVGLALLLLAENMQ
jgi:hypothetical protein